MQTINLNFDWGYKPDFKEAYIKKFPAAERVDIPHANVELPFNNFSEKEYQFISSYEKVFDLSKNDYKRYILRFEGVMCYAEVFVNGKKACEHKGGYTPFKADVTELLVDGENRIFVMVDSTERRDIPPNGFVVDYLTYGGIYREVYLEEREQNFVDMAFAHVGNDELKLHLFLDKKESRDTEFRFSVIKDAKLVHSFERNLDLQKDEYELSEIVQLETWTLDDPVLYDLEIHMDGALTFSTRFAKRKVEISPEGFFLNGKHIKLYGLNRHQSYPYVGYAMPKNAQRKDADILKYELGVNVVRSSHYPPSKHFLDRCDEIGLLVFNEIPGWQHIGNAEWQAVAIENTREMIYRDVNHPSIFIWGTRINESPDNDDFYKKTAAVARELDSTRPIGGVRNFKGSNLIEDVYTYNDFVHRGDNHGLDKAKSVAKKKVPYMVTEYNGHMYPTKKFDDEFHRIAHVERHLKVQDDNFAHKHISGAIGWCMFDYNTHKDFGSGDRICYHGVMDMFRLPKYAAGVYRSQSDHEPYMKILSNLSIGEKEASEIKELPILTNADYVKFYINEAFIGDFYPSDRYKHLPHPPVIVDDFIGNMVHDNEPYSKKDCDRIKSVLMSIIKNGLNIPLREKIKMGIVLAKHKLSIDQAAKFYEKYVGKWGSESIEYKFEAVKDGMVVDTQIVGATHEHQLLIHADDSELQESDTYETTRIVVEHVNAHGNPMDYSSEVIKIDIDGPLRLIGPDTLALIGGSTAFWIRTTGKKGKARVRVNSQNYAEQAIEINVS
jgi:beta-galactosidase